MKKRICIIALAVLMLVSVALPGLSAYSDIPIGAVVSTWFDQYVWEYWLDEMGTALLMDMSTSVELVENIGEWKEIAIKSDAFEDYDFRMKLFHSDADSSITLNDFSDETLDELLAVNCGDVKGRSKVNQLSKQCYVVTAVSEENGTKLSHVLSTYNGWLVHISAKPIYRWVLINEEVALFQAKLIMSLFEGSSFRHLSSFTLEDVDMVLSEPNGKRHLLLDYDEENYKSIVMLSPDGLRGNVRVSFNKRPEFRGQTLATLGDTMRLVLYNTISSNGEDTLEQMQKGMKAMPTLGGEYMLYTNEEEDYNGSVAINGEWSMSISSQRSGIEDEAYLAYCDGLIDSLNRLFLGEKDALNSLGTGAAANIAKTDNSALFTPMALDGCDFTAYYTVDATAQCQPFGSDAHVVISYSEITPEVIYALFVMPADELYGIDMAALTDADKEAMIKRITTDVAHTGISEVAFLSDSGTNALRVWEAVEGQGYTEHLICVSGNYLLNMMVQRIDADSGTTLEMPEIAYQEFVLDNNLVLNKK